jgi:hypothetical protein
VRTPRSVVIGAIFVLIGTAAALGFGCGSSSTSKEAAQRREGAREALGAAASTMPLSARALPDPARVPIARFYPNGVNGSRPPRPTPGIAQTSSASRAGETP